MQEDHHKTPYCKHKGSCVKAILKTVPKITIATYLIKAGLTLVFSLKKIIKKPSFIFSIFTGKEAISFGLFVGSFIGIFRSILCAMRRCTD